MSKAVHCYTELRAGGRAILGIAAVLLCASTAAAQTQAGTPPPAEPATTSTSSVPSSATSAETAAPAPRRTAAQRIAQSLADLRKHEERMTVIGERLSLAAAAAGWCEPAPSLGWTLGEIGQYPKNMRQFVLREWQLPSTATLFVSAVVPNGPAAQAGIRPGMSIINLAGRTPMRNGYDDASRHALTVSERVIREELSSGAPLAFETVTQDGARQSWSIAGRATCPTRFELAAEDDPQAYADGEIVQLTAGMAAFTAEQDDELAGVLAHELAHNLLRHMSRIEDADLPQNYTRFLGRYTRITRSMEEEADRLSVWLLSAAGYDATAPLRFWARFGPDNDSAHPFGRTHDRWQDRVAALEDELAQMRAAKRANPRARPPLLDRATEVPTPGAPRPTLGREPAVTTPATASSG